MSWAPLGNTASHLIHTLLAASKCRHHEGRQDLLQNVGLGPDSMMMLEHLLVNLGVVGVFACVGIRMFVLYVTQ